jgi:hypothetical protein
MMAAVITGRKPLAVYTSLLFRVVLIVNDSIDSRSLHFLAGAKFVPYAWSCH